MYLRDHQLKSISGGAVVLQRLVACAAHYRIYLMLIHLDFHFFFWVFSGIIVIGFTIFVFSCRFGVSGAWLLHCLHLSTTATEGPIGLACRNPCYSPV